MSWYNFVERLAKSGKRLPNYAEFCAYAFGSPAGLDNANTNAWSATSNTGRGVTGSVVNAVSSVGVVDAWGVSGSGWTSLLQERNTPQMQTTTQA